MLSLLLKVVVIVVVVGVVVVVVVVVVAVVVVVVVVAIVMLEESYSQFEGACLVHSRHPGPQRVMIGWVRAASDVLIPDYSWKVKKIPAEYFRGWVAGGRRVGRGWIARKSIKSILAIPRARSNGLAETLPNWSLGSRRVF